MSWSILADVLVGGLLIVTLVYVRRLSARLDTIRSGKAEFEKLIGELAKSTDQAASHLHQFKLTAEITGGDLQVRVEKAQALAGEFGRISEDLKLLTERADSAINRLEATIAKSRAATPKPAAVSPAVSEISDFSDDDDNRTVASLSKLSGMR